MLPRYREVVVTPQARRALAPGVRCRRLVWRLSSGGSCGPSGRAHYRTNPGSPSSDSSQAGMLSLVAPASPPRPRSRGGRACAGCTRTHSDDRPQASRHSSVGSHHRRGRRGRRWIGGRSPRRRQGPPPGGRIQRRGMAGEKSKAEREYASSPRGAPGAPRPCKLSINRTACLDKCACRSNKRGVSPLCVVGVDRNESQASPGGRGLNEIAGACWRRSPSEPIRVFWSPAYRRARRSSDGRSMTVTRRRPSSTVPLPSSLRRIRFTVARVAPARPARSSWVRGMGPA